MGSKNEGEKAFQMAKNAQRYQYRYGTVTFIIMGIGTD